jgi:hypothetical protein
LWEQPWVWTGEPAGFVLPSRVAFQCPEGAAPFLHAVPNELVRFSNLLTALGTLCSTCVCMRSGCVCVLRNCANVRCKCSVCMCALAVCVCSECMRALGVRALCITCVSCIHLDFPALLVCFCATVTPILHVLLCCLYSLCCCTTAGVQSSFGPAHLSSALDRMQDTVGKGGRLQIHQIQFAGVTA